MNSALPRSRRAGHIAIPAVLATLGAVLGSTALAATVFASSATAATTHVPHGRIASAWQDSFTHELHVSGFAYDGGAGRTRTSVRVSLYVDGHYRRTVTARGGSRDYDRPRRIQGRHAFSAVLDVAHRADRVRVQAHAAGQRNGAAWINAAQVHQRSTKTQRIVHVAQRYVGSRYSYGADGPRAFDCSGYSKFVYRKAHIAHLPHNSQAQRHAKHMHRISRSQARPGDLVFYLSGNSAYHVSIYAGHGMQYSATDPSRGVEHSKISSHHVIFKTDWH